MVVAGAERRQWSVSSPPAAARGVAIRAGLARRRPPGQQVGERLPSRWRRSTGGLACSRARSRRPRSRGQRRRRGAPARRAGTGRRPRRGSRPGCGTRTRGPSRTPATRAARGRRAILVPRHDAEQRHEPEGQHLDVVAVVAQAVPGDEDGREREVDARGEGEVRAPPRPLREEEGARRRTGNRTRRTPAQRPGGGRRRAPRARGQVRLQAAAVRHVGDEHEVLEAVADPQGDDAGQRAVRGDVPAPPCQASGRRKAKARATASPSFRGEPAAAMRPERRAPGGEPREPGDQEHEGDEGRAGRASSAAPRCGPSNQRAHSAIHAAAATDPAPRRPPLAGARRASGVTRAGARRR